MAFSQKTYVFSHTITKSSAANQPVVFPIDIRDIIPPFGKYSPMFVIESMSVQAHKQDTSERIPVRFTVLNDAKTRIVTNDPARFSSKWDVDVCGASSVKIAGTDETPFRRMLSVYDEDNRQALMNVLAFMMSPDSVQTADRARSSLDTLKAQCAYSRDFNMTCELCRRESVAQVVVRDDPGQPALRVPLCEDGYVCVPERADPHREAQTHRGLIALLRSAYTDNLSIVREAVDRARFVDGNGCLSTYRHDRGVEVFPYQLMRFILTLYRTLIEQADTLAVVDEKAPCLKVLIESPSDKIGYVSGSATLTLLYGASVLDVYRNVNAGAVEGVEERLDLTAAVAQFSCDTLIRRFPLDFHGDRHNVSMGEWCSFYCGNNKA